MAALPPPYSTKPPRVACHEHPRDVEVPFCVRRGGPGGGVRSCDSVYLSALFESAAVRGLRHTVRAEVPLAIVSAVGRRGSFAMPGYPAVEDTARREIRRGGRTTVLASDRGPTFPRSRVEPAIGDTRRTRAAAQPMTSVEPPLHVLGDAGPPPVRPHHRGFPPRSAINLNG